MYNAAIVGAGPAGIFTALELVKLKPDWKIILIEKGNKIEKRETVISHVQAAKPADFFADGAVPAHFLMAN